MPNTYWIAFSGGLDSHVLLHFLSRHYAQYPFNAIHINHQLQPESQHWETHCRNICRSLNIPLKIIRVAIQRQPGESLEAKAREARYAAFINILKKDDILFTAHHQDDQAETFLFQLLRGAGQRGVSAMPAASQLGQGFLLRPLLCFLRRDLEAYAHAAQLTWIEDLSNQDTRFDRNYLRHVVFPTLKKRWPQYNKTFSRFAQHCAEQEKLLKILAAQDAQTCQGKYLNTLFMPALKLLEKSRQKNLLRYFIGTLNLIIPPEKILTEILKTCGAAVDKNPMITWSGIECRRFKNHLFIMPAIKPRAPALTPGELNWCQQNLQNYSEKLYSITYRKGGEKFKPQSSHHTTSLKKLFQAWQIPPWLRDKIPLIYHNNTLIAIVGYSI